MAVTTKPWHADQRCQAVLCEDRQYGDNPKPYNEKKHNQHLLTESLMKYMFLPVLLASLTTLADNTAYIDVNIENASSRAQYVEVVDTQCQQTRNSGCQMADIMLNSEPCQQNANSQGCNRARTILNSFECIEGGLYSGQMAAHQQVTVSPCASRTGTARLKTRNSKTSPWTVHSWVRKNSVVKVK